MGIQLPSSSVCGWISLYFKPLLQITLYSPDGFIRFHSVFNDRSFGFVLCQFKHHFRGSLKHDPPSAFLKETHPAFAMKQPDKLLGRLSSAGSTSSILKGDVRIGWFAVVVCKENILVINIQHLKSPFPFKKTKDPPCYSTTAESFWFWQAHTFMAAFLIFQSLLSSVQSFQRQKKRPYLWTTSFWPLHISLVRSLFVRH